MLGEVVASHEAAEACGTGKPFLPRVRPPVAGQLVGAGEPPLAALPLALEGLLTCWNTSGMEQFVLIRASIKRTFYLAYGGLLALQVLTRVCPHVGLEVGALEVGLAAVLTGTDMAACTGRLRLQRVSSLLRRGWAGRRGDGQ